MKPVDVVLPVAEKKSWYPPVNVLGVTMMADAVKGLSPRRGANCKGEIIDDFGGNGTTTRTKSNVG